MLVKNQVGQSIKYRTYFHFYHAFNSLDFCLTKGTTVFSAYISSHSKVGRLICYLQRGAKQIMKNNMKIYNILELEILASKLDSTTGIGDHNLCKESLAV